MSAVMKIIAFANRPPEDMVDHLNKYIVDFDFECGFGFFGAKTTPDVKKAKKFPDKGAAMEYWRTRSKTYPNRPNDGRPNRPLTAAMVEITDLPADSSSPA